MPAPMDGKALGLIETQGYAALIAATDAAVKAAPVEVRSVERASGGLVLITIVGDVAAVQEAVAAGAERAAEVGRLLFSHVIPRPDEAVWRIIGVEKPPARADAPQEDLEALPVRQLRRMARALPGMPLSGREISRASKAELIEAIRTARRA